jgi:hypothetical protein
MNLSARGNISKLFFKICFFLVPNADSNPLFSYSIVKIDGGYTAEAPDWNSFHLQHFPTKLPLLDPHSGIPVRSYDRSCGKSISLDQLMHRVNTVYYAEMRKSRNST